MPNTRDIRRRIKSVQSTKKITKAMELVSTSKMRRAIGEVLATRPYANLSWATVLNIAKGKRSEHPLLSEKRKNPSGRVGIVAIASNRALCAGYNTQLINKVISFIKKENLRADMFLMGKKTREIVYKHGQNAAAEFEKLDFVNKVEEIRPLSKMVMEDFLSGKYDRILVAYTDFISTIKQRPSIKQLLPIDIKTQDKLGIIGDDPRIGIDEKFVEKKQEKYLAKESGYNYEYVFEPSAKEILDEMLPRLIEIQLYQALLEANASEHSARMMAMKNASDAASDMIYDLSLVYNKTRQAAITREITEISAGAAALEE